ncbi:MAG: type II secretion system F family protein [Propionibacteriales bacterium]|nr:type II secretion system F family protein [Propionibacteriales bacterium]
MTLIPLNLTWVLVAGGCAGLAVLAWWPSTAARLRPPPDASPASSAAFAGWRRIGSAVATGAAVWFATSGLGWLSIVIGGAAAVGSYVMLGRLVGAAEEKRRAALSADLPQACDLIVSCLSAGLPLLSAVRVVAGSTAGPLAEELAEAMAKITLGVDETRVWSELAGCPPLATFARELSRGAATGVSLAERIADVGVQARQEAAAAAEVRARKVGVSSVLPLMVCFLPSFVLLGLVPVVGGIVSKLFG